MLNFTITTMKRYLLFIIASFVYAFSFAQGELDAYRYSNDDLSGTARGQAMGGAFGALGGDVTGVAINPAGIGVYRSSEVVANMSLTSALTGGKSYQESNTKFHFDNLSYVGYYPMVKGSMLSFNFGFNYNRIKSFDQVYSTSSQSMNSSLTDYIVHLLNEKNINHGKLSGSVPYYNPDLPWLGILGWRGYLINEAENTTNQYESILNKGELVKPHLRVTEKGKVESYDFTFGSNIANKFYWGATFTITDFWYWMSSSYDEEFAEGGGFNLENSLETKGSGFQAKLGVIYKPVDALRLGIAYHSPVWYTMTDYFDAGLTPNLTPRGIYTEDGKPVGYTETGGAIYDYKLRTPGSWTFSAATVLGAKAIVSLDYEIKNYASMNLSDNDGEWIHENGLIKEDFKNASTVRAGFEYRFTPQFSGRIGYAWTQNPYRTDMSLQSLGEIIEPAGTIPNYTLSGDISYLTAGIGFRFNPQFYGDFALVLRSQKDDLYYFPPDTEGSSFVDTFTNKTLKGLITLGYKF
jgi:long-subunit fatty acid transport protein